MARDLLYKKRNGEGLKALKTKRHKYGLCKKWNSEGILGKIEFVSRSRNEKIRIVRF